MSSDLNNFKNEAREFSDELKAINSSDLYNAFKYSIIKNISLLESSNLPDEELEAYLDNLKSKLEELKELKDYYEKYKSSYITSKTKNQLEELFNKVDEDTNQDWKLEFVDDIENISKVIDSEYDKLNDSTFFWNSFLEQVEDNITFTRTSLAVKTFWSKDIDDFLKSFTVEYLNLLEKNWNINNEHIKEWKIFLTKGELEIVVKNALLNTNDYIWSISVELSNWEKTEIDFSKFKDNTPIPDNNFSFKKRSNINYKKDILYIEENEVVSDFSKYHYDKVLKKHPNEIEKLFILIRDREINLSDIVFEDLNDTIIAFQSKYMTNLENKYMWYFWDKTSKLVNEVFAIQFEKNEYYNDYLEAYYKIIKLIPELKIDWNVSFLNLKKVLLDYQLKKAIIKNKNSVWAWILWPRTKEDIKLSSNYYELKSKEINKEWNISQNLFYEENNNRFLLTSFLEKQKNINWLYILPELNSDLLFSIVNNKLKDLKTWKIYLNWVNTMKEYTFNSKTIEYNKDIFIHNFSVLIQFFADIESYWWKKFIKNWKSSAKWIFQFLDFNFYWEKNSGQSSWETAIQRNKNIHNSIGLKTSKSFDFIYNNKDIISPLSISTESLIDIFISNIYYWAINKWIKEDVLNFLSWNQWSLRKIYEKIHHTEKKEWVTNKETEKLTDFKIAHYWKLLKPIKQK